MPWLVQQGLSLSQAILSLKRAALPPVNFKYCVSDNVLDQFIDVRIISIVQQYFKFTITKQFEPQILNLMQFVSKVLVTVGENKHKQTPRYHIIKVGMGDIGKISLKRGIYPFFIATFFPLFRYWGYMHTILCHVMQH